MLRVREALGNSGPVRPLRPVPRTAPHGSGGPRSPRSSAQPAAGALRLPSPPGISVRSLAALPGPTGRARSDGSTAPSPLTEKAAVGPRWLGAAPSGRAPPGAADEWENPSGGDPGVCSASNLPSSSVSGGPGPGGAGRGSHGAEALTQHGPADRRGARAEILFSAFSCPAAASPESLSPSRPRPRHVCPVFLRGLGRTLSPSGPPDGSRRSRKSSCRYLFPLPAVPAHPDPADSGSGWVRSRRHPGLALAPGTAPPPPPRAEPPAAGGPVEGGRRLRRSRSETTNFRGETTGAFHVRSAGAVWPGGPPASTGLLWVSQEPDGTGVPLRSGGWRDSPSLPAPTRSAQADSLHLGLSFR